MKTDTAPVPMRLALWVMSRLVAASLVVLVWLFALLVSDSCAVQFCMDSSAIHAPIPAKIATITATTGWVKSRNINAVAYNSVPITKALA